MEGFITGRSVISSSGDFAPPNPASARRHEYKLREQSRFRDEEASSNSPDSEEGEKNADIALAERTSQLMSSYRD